MMEHNKIQSSKNPFYMMLFSFYDYFFLSLVYHFIAVSFAHREILVNMQIGLPLRGSDISK